MAQKVQKLSDEQLQKIGDLQNKISETLLSLGEGHLRLRDLNSELERIKEIIKKYEQEFDSFNAQYNEILSDLEKQYPNGELDLAQGTVTFEE
jgi:archaellum component FlaC